MNPTPSSALIDVSALLLYRDDEDCILPAVQALNSAFAPAAISLEIIPIDLGSGDNCNALMTLLPPMPASCELRAPVHVAAHSLFAPALREAHGRVLCVLDAAAAIASQGELVAAGEELLRAAKLSRAREDRLHCLADAAWLYRYRHGDGERARECLHQLLELDPEHSLKHVLYSALGATRAEPFTLSTDVRWDDVMLLCSDGVTKHVSDDEIREALLRSTSAEATAR